jgi:glutamate synthase (NADPH/NADH) large chain
MSGGVAYVLDETGDFAQRCNLSMVDLQPIPAEEETIERLHHHGGDLESHGLVDVTAHMERNDAERIWELLIRHHKYTGSARAGMILDNWAGMLPKFVKIMPVEYARALRELEKAQETSDGMTIGVKRSA